MVKLMEAGKKEEQTGKRRFFGFKKWPSGNEQEKVARQLEIDRERQKSIIQELKKKGGDDNVEFRQARGYLKLSNKLFLNKANKLISKGRFSSLGLEIKKANIDMLLGSYLSIIFFSMLLSFVISAAVVAVFVFYSGNYLLALAKFFWLIIALPALTFLILYFYPSAERKSQSRKIEQELPFAVIHMSAISGSGISPSEIFRIIGLSREYPYLRKEIKKVLNQINIYGYDLITALNNTAKTTPSVKLAELFNGLSAAIQSGGELSAFFDKRAETLLLNYRLEREKYTRTAETMMDIYITVVIATPMILMLLLVMIAVSGINIGLGITELTFVIVSIVALVNVLFLGFLQIKQPSY